MEHACLLRQWWQCVSSIVLFYVSSSTIQIQDVEPLSQPATAVSVKNNSVDGSSSTNQLWRRRNLKLRSGVILKPPKDGRAYKPNEIKLLGKRFPGKILQMPFLRQGTRTRQKLLYTGILRVLTLYIRHCHMKNSWRSMHWPNMIHWQLIKHVEQPNYLERWRNGDSSSTIPKVSK